MSLTLYDLHDYWCDVIGEHAPSGLVGVGPITGHGDARGFTVHFRHPDGQADLNFLVTRNWITWEPSKRDWWCVLPTWDRARPLRQGSNEAESWGACLLDPDPQQVNPFIWAEVRSFLAGDGAPPSSPFPQ